MKHAISRLLMTAALCGILAMIPGKNAEASERMPITTKNFNAIEYANLYPDVKEVFGYNREALANHYLQYGQAEGRRLKSYIARESLLTKATFNAAQYAADNPDVAAVMGNNADALWNHYLNYGVAEGRKAWSTNPKEQAYLLAYDILEGSITNDMLTTEQLRILHDELCRRVTYVKTPNCHSAYGALAEGQAVCQGYTLAYDMFLDMLGVDYTHAYGPNHIWNKVELGGNWYNIDVTWDDHDFVNYIGYDCFLISDAEMARIHNAGTYHWNGRTGSYY